MVGMNNPAALALPRHNRRLMRVGGGPPNGEDLLRQHYEPSKNHSRLGKFRQHGCSNTHVT
jgi:hypothetical protein